MELELFYEDFSLVLEPVYYIEDKDCPVNTTLKVTVETEDFRMQTSMDIDWEDLKDFAADLCRVYETLSGEARIAEPYGRQMYLSFQGDGLGHIAVSGSLCRVDERENCYSVEFDQQIDQTCLNEWCYRWKSACLNAENTIE